jgi:hypothetical protein
MYAGGLADLKHCNPRYVAVLGRLELIYPPVAPLSDCTINSLQITLVNSAYHGLRRDKNSANMDFGSC